MLLVRQRLVKKWPPTRGFSAIRSPWLPRDFDVFHSPFPCFPCSLSCCGLKRRRLLPPTDEGREGATSGVHSDVGRPGGVWVCTGERSAGFGVCSLCNYVMENEMEEARATPSASIAPCLA